MRRFAIAMLTMGLVAAVATPAAAWNDSTYLGECVFVPGPPSIAAQGVHVGTLTGSFKTRRAPLTATDLVSASVTCYGRVNGAFSPYAVLRGGTMSGPSMQFGIASFEFSYSPAFDVLDACWVIDYTNPNDTTTSINTC